MKKNLHVIKNISKESKIYNLSKKIKTCIVNNPIIYLIMFITFILLFGTSIIALPKGGINLIIIPLITFFLLMSFSNLLKETKARKSLENLNLQDYEKMYEEYISLVNQTAINNNYNLDFFDKNWIKLFHDYIYDIANIYVDSNDIYIHQFSDFDIAACLIFALTKTNKNDDYILLSFECAKKIISEPKIYYLTKTYRDEIKLNLQYTLKKVDLKVPDEIIKPDVITTLLKIYLSEDLHAKDILYMHGIDILQFSDFLNVIYLKCK